MSEMQRALDTALMRASPDEKKRFSLLLAPDQRATQASDALDVEGTQVSRNPFAASIELRLDHDPDVNDVLDWLDEHAEWSNGEARKQVSDLTKKIDIRAVKDASRRRSRVSRSAIAEALAGFYSLDSSDYELYWAGSRIETSILTRPEWLDLRLVMGQGRDDLSLRSNTGPSIGSLDAKAAQAAAVRIAEVLATDTRLVNRPLYQLLEVEIGPQCIKGSLGLTHFSSYALTMDLLERELLDAIASGAPITSDSLPLRERYLASIDAVIDVSNRLCAGGPLALFAAARPRDRRRSTPDYVLLVQERSGRVLNATRRLAVIPKSFHEPLVDFSDDAQISATLERELEEELFGRTDVDSTEGKRRNADPLNLNRLSGPMRWLMDNANTDQWRMECTSFGFNLVSGNFEFASLIVIDDEDWWARFGGRVEANWESEGLRRYSSLDRDGLDSLIHDPSWSNEGLFAFAQGIRRLSEINEDRVRSPLE
ncbi:hypothetical protein [Planosporangium mesophilum]|uniref:hypothetical protein n=1 Tax=Planosporangium mesophilum TaxID=689768 RepID=UPI001950CE33|nr:hypothetical protein [Planosporangium mesophilum]